MQLAQNDFCSELDFIQARTAVLSFNTLLFLRSYFRMSNDKVCVSMKNFFSSKVDASSHGALGGVSEKM